MLTIAAVVSFQTRPKWDDPNWVVPSTREDMLSEFSGWGPHVLKILSAIPKPDIWALFNHPPARTYHNGRICLLGDAAHASTPHQGAGAGMCLEDAYIMSNLMAEAKGIEDLEDVFRAYDTVRRPRTQRLVETSREAGTLYDFELEGDDLAKMERNLTSRMSWIWDEDLSAQLEMARKLMKTSGTQAKI